jgi:hypothetical protein
MSRFMDLAGWNIWIDSNYYTGQGGHPTNCGEGILWQRWNSVECFSAAVTHNIQGPTGEKGYIAPYDNYVIGLLIGWNRMRDWSESHVGVRKIAYDSSVNITTDVSVIGNLNDDGSDAEIVGNTVPEVLDFMDACPGGGLTPPTNVKVVTDNNKNIITWVDATDNEAGFRIDRRIHGTNTWTTIAYRPRNETDTVFNYSVPNGYGGGPTNQCTNQLHDYNEQKWVDYNVKDGVIYDYKAVSINCNDDDEGASSPVVTALVKIISGIRNHDMLIYPNPAKDLVEIQLTLKHDDLITVSVYDINGKPMDKVIQNKSLPKGEHSFNYSVSNYPAGVYLVTIESLTNSVTSLLLVQQ